MKIEADKYSGCIIYWIALYIDKWIKEDWLSWGLVMRYGPLGHPCDSQQGQELTKCGLNWWWQSSFLTPDVQIIKVTTVTGTTLQPRQRIQISFLIGSWKAMEKQVLQKPGWSTLWGSSQNGCSCSIFSADAQTAPVSTAIKSTLN